MLKKILITLSLAAVALFAFDWGIYGGPRATVTFTNMNPVRDELNASDNDYNFPAFSFFQPGFSFPIYLRLWRFTIGGGDITTWQWSDSDDWRVTFNHNVSMVDFGYIIDLSPNIRLRPTMGIGSYNIAMRLLKKGTGFGEPGDTTESAEWDYSSVAFSGGLSAGYIWKFEKRIVVGLEAKLGYVVPMGLPGDWEGPDGRTVDIPDFFPHTPTVSIGMIIGYEKAGEEKIEEGWEEE